MADPYGVKPQHLYWSSVATSGWVDVEWKARHDAPDVLPPGLRATLKAIEGNNAFLYRTDLGVLRVPAHVLEPWHR